ncbi:MAG: RagB/SusD family nutrient uptake outer membrane protein [Bacteroidetes bacterium]|nr:RagB/SusD family nutrient uptake outer membrane protein [Bacteroidota bacterium]
MKKKIYIIMTLAILVISGCEKSDFLNIKPEDLTLTENAFTSPEDIERYLISAYDVVRNGAYLGGNMWTVAEVWSTNCNTNRTGFGWSQIINNNTNIFNTEGRSLWNEAYRSIDRANYANRKMEDFPDIDPAMKTRIAAESYFINAVGHFELVRFFALPYDETKAGNNTQPGLPIRTLGTGTIGEAFEVMPRSTVEETYNHIIAYLEQAATSLPESNNGFATSWASKAYLAKVYFQQNNFNNAFEYANEIIESNVFSLDDNLTDRFDPALPSNEVIFELISTAAGDNSGASLEGAFRQDGTQNPSVFPSDNLVNIASAEPEDKRWQTWFNTRLPDPEASVEKTYAAKYDYDYLNVPMAYLAEIYLIRAECGAEGATGGSLSQALADVNKVIERAFGNSSHNLTSTNNLIENIRKQRRIEMCFEGNQMHELKRTKAQNINGLPWNDPYLIFEIPDIELNGNPNMVKNH